MSNDKTKRYLDRLKVLDSEFEPLKSVAIDVRDFINPAAGWFPDRTEKPYDPIGHDERFNCEPTRAWQTHASGMLQGMASPSRPWIQLEAANPALNSVTPVKQWLDGMERLYLRTFAQSNFYNVHRLILGEQGGFGTGAYMPEPIPNPPYVHFHHFPFGSYRLALNKYGHVDTIYRPVKMTARVISQWFGKENVSHAVKDAAEKHPYKWFDVVHVVEPRSDDEREYGRVDNRNMPFKSVWFEKGQNNKILKESGYPVFPVITPRFLSMDYYPYGIGPGIDAIKRVRMLQQMEEEGLVGLHREVRPPLQADSMWDGTLDLTPDALNFGLGGPLSPIIQTNINWQHFQFRLDKLEDSINRAFMVDLFLMISQAAAAGEDPQKTATEVLKMDQEKMIVLGPVVENQISQNYDKLIDLLMPMFFSIPGLVPPPPPDLQGENVKAKYVSTLAQAQRMAEVDSIYTLLNVRDRVTGGNPAHPLNNAVNDYQILKTTEEASGVPANVLRGEDEYAQILEANRQAQEQAAQMAQIEQAANAANKLGGASTEAGTALGDLTGGGNA